MIQLEVLQMRLRLSIVLLLALGPHSVSADALSLCPPPQISYTCEQGAPRLAISHNTRGAALDFKLAAMQSGSVLHDTLMSLPSGASTQYVPLTTLPDTAQQIAVVGSDKDGACCVSTVTLHAPPIDLCNPQKAHTEDVPKAKEQPSENPGFDVAVTLELDPICPEGAAAHACTGTLGISVQGVANGLLPLTLEIKPTQGIDTVLGGPLSCYQLGQGAQFCRAPTEILSEGLTLPIQISADASYEKRTARLCATLAMPGDKIEQIKLVQTALRALDYDPGLIDGRNGPSTRKAVKTLAARFGLSLEEPLDPAFLMLLGLGPFEDANASNNQACAETVLPPQPRPKIIAPKPKIPPKKTHESEITYDDPAPQCDPQTTVLRGGKCACRYEGMYRFNATRCLCENGQPPAAGAQCF